MFKRLSRFFIRYKIVEVPSYVAIEDLLSRARSLLAVRPDDGGTEIHYARVKIENLIKRAQGHIQSDGFDLERAIKGLERIVK